MVHSRRGPALPVRWPLLVLITAAASAAMAQTEPVVGLPCERCEGVFLGLPDDLESTARIAPPSEPGEPMRLVGVVRDDTGRPSPGIIVYAYQTNAEGIYPRDQNARGTAAYRHGTLRAWAVTDGAGRYEFLGIRPGGYPGSGVPQHVHMHIIEPGRCTYYIGDTLFDDDPRLSERARARAANARGGSGLASPGRDESGTWQVTRDIVLGKGVPGYAEDCG